MDIMDITSSARQESLRYLKATLISLNDFVLTNLLRILRCLIKGSAMHEIIIIMSHLFLEVCTARNHNYDTGRQNQECISKIGEEKSRTKSNQIFAPVPLKILF